MSNVVQVQQQIAAGLNTIHAIQHQVLHRIRDIDMNLKSFSTHLDQITINNIGSKKGMIVSFSALLMKMIKDVERVVENPQLLPEVREEMRKLHMVLDTYVSDINTIAHYAENTNVKNYQHNINMLNLLINNMIKDLVPALIYLLQGLDKLDKNSMNNRDNLISAMQKRVDGLQQQLRAA